MYLFTASLLLVYVKLVTATQHTLEEGVTLRQAAGSNSTDKQARRCTLAPKLAKRTTIASSASPIGAYLWENIRGDSELGLALEDFQKYNSLLEEQLEDPRQCDLESRLVQDASSFTQFFGLGALSTRACGTFFNPPHNYLGTDSLKRISSLAMLPSEKLWEKMKRLDLSDIVKNTGTYWNNSIPSGNTVVRKRYRVCSVVGVTAFRIEGKWALWSTIRTIMPWIRLKRQKRLLLSEVVYMDGKTRTPQNVSVKLQLPQCIKNATRLEGTTVFQRRGRSRGLSVFGIMRTEDNPALKAAIEDGEQYEQAVVDSRLPSNIAIVVLPMALAAVPLALFADVSTVFTLAYTVATDIVSVLPAAIKGIELIAYGRKSTYAARSHVFGPEVTNGFLTTETWVAECHLDSSFEISGIILLTVAIVVMFTGAILEFFAKRKVEKLKAESLDHRPDFLEEPNMSIFEDNLTSPNLPTPFLFRRDYRDNTAPSVLRGGLIWSLARRKEKMRDFASLQQGKQR